MLASACPSWKRRHNQFKCSAGASLPGHLYGMVIGCNLMLGHHIVRRAWDEPSAWSGMPEIRNWKWRLAKVGIPF